MTKKLNFLLEIFIYILGNFNFFCHFVTYFAWNFQNSRFSNIFEVMEQKQAKYEKIPNLYQDLFFFYPEIWIFCKTSMSSFMSFFAFYYMKFPKFKIPENFWSYGAKTGRNSGNFQISMKNWNFAYEFFIFLKFRSWILWHFSRSFT